MGQHSIFVAVRYRKVEKNILYNMSDGNKGTYHPSKLPKSKEKVGSYNNYRQSFGGDGGI